MKLGFFMLIIGAIFLIIGICSVSASRMGSNMDKNTSSKKRTGLKVAGIIFIIVGILALIYFVMGFMTIIKGLSALMYI